jgi:protein-tyrosine phosphatase
VIDLHLHILPGLDDGAPSIDVSAAMLERSAQLGFRELVATPHLTEPLSDARRAHAVDALIAVRELATRLDVDVRLGYEILLTPDLPERLAGGEQSRLSGSQAVLVELPFVAWPNHTADTVFALQAEGFRPVLAHAERYLAVQEVPSLAIALAERGIVLQLTIGSVAGLFGKAARVTAEALLRAGAIGVVATDAHSAGHRYVSVDEGLARLRKLVNEDGVSLLTDAIPRALLNDLPLPENPVVVNTGTTRWFGALFGRSGAR